MTRAITISRVLQAIDNHDWVQEDGSGVPIYLNKFRAMMINSELINNRRKIDEWYDNLRIAGYIKGLNKTMDVFIPEKIAAKLGTTIEEKLGIKLEKVEISLMNEC